MGRRRLPHQRAFGAVTVAACAHDSDQPAHDMGAHRLQRGGDGVGGMGVIHKHRPAIVPRGGKLHAAAHGGQMRQSIEHMGGVRPAGNHQPRREQHVVRLKPANEVQAFLVGLAAIAEPQVLPRRIEALAGQMQITAVAPHGDHLAAAGACDGDHIDPLGIINIDHRRAVLGQHPREQSGLGVEIGVEGLVVVEMVLGKIREPRRFERHAIQPPLVQPVA